MKSNSTIQTHVLGYPRIGKARELKKATEAYWSGKSAQQELLTVAANLRRENWKTQQEKGIDLIPVNDFSFYDQILDMSCLVGNIPPRFAAAKDLNTLDVSFLIARGTLPKGAKVEESCQCCSGKSKLAGFASEMTKWFDTNYHYIVPEFHADTQFKLSSSKVFDELAEAQALGINAKPVLPGPITYLLVGKVLDKANPDLNPLSLLERLLPVYEEILAKLAAQGAQWIQLDEPILATDLNDAQKAAFSGAYKRLANAAGSAKLLVTTYFGDLRDNLDTFINLPVAALHIDAVRGTSDVDAVIAKIPADKILSLGVVEGRNIWKNDLTQSLAIIEKAKAKLGESRVWIAPSCSLLHSPITLANEKKLDPEIKNWLAFAEEKLVEVALLKKLALGQGGQEELKANQAAVASRKTSTRIHNQAVKARLAAVTAKDYDRQSPFAVRQGKQRAKLGLPKFPTTTIGSFPQTQEVRAARAKWKKGELSDAEYDAFIKEETRKCVQFQDEIDIDMPVHGEFERNDMVEYFGEQLEGFIFTSNGWVQSFGSRYVKPPIIFGDVSRPKPMTTYWSEFAQTLTKRPMKGMLTGPITILQWSFVRDDQPREITTKQIALAIRDEVTDLEKIGIAAIQIDEPAVREGLPLRRADWAAYLKWAVDSFRLSASSVRDETQIHTHMCYSEFNDIIDSIAALDADVITIETSRSNMELLNSFVAFKYPAEIGPGVYDIHSPRIPTEEEMINLMKKAIEVLPADNLWVNPDCGLKTRAWEEVKPSLKNMVEVAKTLRKSV
jgi:5-methyltetrahydropteroyltriglutamate--homocysteine methyltransferase